jgi:hypothetical protein
MMHAWGATFHHGSPGVLDELGRKAQSHLRSGVLGRVRTPRAFDANIWSDETRGPAWAQK